MKIELKQIPIRDLVNGYINNEEEGVFGYAGKLNIRPKYQREFVYKDKQRIAVIETVRNDFPLNTIYWAKNGDDSYELLDGQQRTISICQYVAGEFSVDFGKGPQFFHNLLESEKDKAEQILNYQLMVYSCEGTDSEKLAWFKIINTAVVQLTGQELRNAVYTGAWLTDSKRYFSKTGCPAYNIASDYIKGSPIRQELLEAALGWISNNHIEDYMAKNQHEPNANEIWLYFQSVVAWIKAVFPVVRKKEMQGVDWGSLYNQYKNDKFDAKKIEEEVSRLMEDEDVTKQSGIYAYVLSRDEKHLNLRLFSDKQKRIAYQKQKSVCPDCGEKFEIHNMEGDHDIPWSLGGKLTQENCRMRCIPCNRSKGGKGIKKTPEVAKKVVNG